MKKIIFGIFGFSLLFCSLSFAYPVADSFQFPLDNYVVGCNNFWGTCVKEWHLGEDVDIDAGTNVYAIGNGIVKHAQYHAPTYNDEGILVSKNYGGMYIIEHTLLSGEIVCAVYGHLDFDSFAKSVGQEVCKGELICKIGTYSQNGCWGEHLHLGIRKGAFPADWWKTVCNGEWIFAGYTACTFVKDDWYDPTDFIQSHQSAPTRFMDFEDGVDEEAIKSNIPGMVFTTTQGYDWIYGDWREGYNGPYPDGAYYSNGHFFAWLGPNQGAGRIDFTGATATYLSVLTSTASGLTMDAYDSDNNWLANSGWADSNINTGEMTKLTVAAPNMAYVLVHDTGNRWLIDDLEIGDLLAEVKAYLPASFIAEYEDIDTLDQGTSKWKAFFNEIHQKLKIILGWGGSELSIQIYNPDGILYDEYQSKESLIIIDIPNAEPGLWKFKITAIDVPENNYPFALVVGTCPNTLPIADAGSDQTVAVGNDCIAAVVLDGSISSDPDGDPLAYTWTWDDGSAIGVAPSVELLLGTSVIILVVNDGIADSEPDTVQITVVDQTPPEITVTAAPNILWPPNHKMVDINITVEVSDNCDADPDIVLTSVISNEPDNGKHDGNTINDIQNAEIGTEDYNITLRAERSGTGDGRIYTITCTATDASGNSASASDTVTVPHNKDSRHQRTGVKK